jgi:ADP-L-glycero-D-manno-heptose 6-epimerase
MIAITGALGFIGSNLAHRLATAGHELLLVDHPFAAEKAGNLVGLPSFRYIAHEPFLDLLHGDRPRLDGIFHLGACSRTTETSWPYLERNNIAYSQSLWNWCATSGCPFVYASSAATYGDGSDGFNDRTAPAQLRPLNLYGKSKNDFDFWALAQAAKPTPPNWAGMKFFNVYGPREAHKLGMSSVVLHAYRQIHDSGEVRLFRSNDPAVPDGAQKRDFVFVEDCIDHMLWLWRHPQASGLYNSGTGVARTFLDLAHAVFAALEREPAIRFVSMSESLSHQYQNFTQADMTRLLETGFAQKPTALEEGVRRYVQFLAAGACPLGRVA